MSHVPFSSVLTLAALVIACSTSTPDGAPPSRAGDDGAAAATPDERAERTALPPVEECASPDPAWIWCDDFERDRLDRYFEHENPDGNSFVRTGGVGVRGSAGMRARFRKDQVNAGNLKLAFGRTPQRYFESVAGARRDYREIYWRVYLRHQEGWIGGGGHKLSRATSFVSRDSWAQSMIAHVWSGSDDRRNVLVLDPAAGTDTGGAIRSTGYNDFDNLRWLGNTAGTTPLFDGDHVGRWYCIEARLRLNDPGRDNGIFELWIDERLETRSEGLNWVGSYTGYGINALFLENYWNDGAPATQERYFDAVVVSTERIGC